jgi:hypothetical protein
MIFHTTCILGFAVASLAVAHPKPRNITDAKHGAVASESSVCSQIGIDIFRAGGNAADSVIDDFAKLKILLNLNLARSNPAMRGSRCYVPLWHWWRRVHDRTL